MGTASVPCVLDRDSLVCRGSNHPGRGPDNLGLLDRGGSNPPRIIGPGVTAKGGSNHPSTPDRLRNGGLFAVSFSETLVRSLPRVRVAAILSLSS